MRTAVALVAIGGIAITVTTSTTTALAPVGGQAPSNLQPAAFAQAGATQQTIRLESVDGRVRIRLEGPETWSIDATGFDVIPDEKGLRFRAQPLDIYVQTAKTDSVAQEFELTVSPAGTLGFDARNMSRRRRP